MTTGPYENEVVIAIFAAALIVVILGSFGIIFTIIYKKKQTAFKIEKSLLQTKFQEQLLQTRLEIQEQTLQYISHELHDNLGQIASLIKIHLNTVKFNEPKLTKAKIEESKSLLRQLIHDLKSLSVSLNADQVIQLGLLEGLKRELKRIDQLDIIKTNFIHSGLLPDLDDHVVIILFRISQEILNNVLKHSSAKNLDVSLIINKNSLTLKFSDDGLGFNVKKAMKKGGLGLLNIQRRAEMINSNLSIISTIKGTHIKVELEF